MNRTLVILLTVFCAQVSIADVMRIAVTTSFENSGLADVLLPEIKHDLDLDVQLLVVGTGQALRLGEAGDVDAILVHSKAAEEAFVAAGHGTHRREIMYNDFVVVGPKSDGADVGAASNAADALSRIVAADRAPFVSRGDDSGTHKAELAIWTLAGVDIADLGLRYQSVGAGMGAALNTAVGLDAYVFSDRASWLNFGNKGELVLLYQGDPVLFNQYAYLPINPSKNSHIRNDLAIQLEDWLTSQKASTLIDDYQIAGEKLFTFNASLP
ncbi:substrate-binding domain-containing protein [Ascidiaceihabitans sp.]|jgi:tungstate transport system substrate-binding protein|nr:substrate-binding domain-containing protein [Ascidiaceihabitans sp.]